MRMQMTGQVQCKWVVKSVQLRSMISRHLNCVLISEWLISITLSIA